MRFSVHIPVLNIVTACQYTLQFNKIVDIMSAPDCTCLVDSEEM